MSHGKARKESNCLNCNAEVTGRFCSVCGQENIEPRETFWELTTHFTYDLFHYDGKFFSTLKVLLLKPGVLTREYVRGRRAAYLHPIRMYVFTSAIFFIIFISFIIGGKNGLQITNQSIAAQKSAINKSIDRLKDSALKTNDSAKKTEILQSIHALQKVPVLFADTTHAEKQSGSAFIRIDTSDNHAANYFSSGLPATLAEYNRQQDSLPANKRDGWFRRQGSTKLIEINEKYRYNLQGLIDDFTEHFFHSLPTMMFVSLPVVALIFLLLYVRRRNQFTYVQHGVFAVHIYIAAYIFILIVYGFNLLQSVTGWRLFGFLASVTIIGIFYYIYRAMRNFYQQSRWKTILKFFILSATYSILLAVLMAIFFMTSLIQI